MSPVEPIKNWVITLTGLQRVIYLLGVAAIGWVLLDKFGPKGAILGTTFDGINYDLAIAYIASLFFYELVVDIPGRQTQRKLFERIHPLLAQVLECCRLAIQEIGSVAGEQMTMASHHVDDTVLSQLCHRANPHAPSRMHDPTGIPATLLQYLDHWVIESKKIVDQILVFAPLLDAELIRLLNGIVGSSYFRVMDGQRGFPPMQNQNVAFLAQPLQDYRRACYDLADYLVPRLCDDPIISLFGSEQRALHEPIAPGQQGNSSSDQA